MNEKEEVRYRWSEFPKPQIKEDFSFEITNREKRIQAIKSRCVICRGNGYDRHNRPCRECSRL